MTNSARPPLLLRAVALWWAATRVMIVCACLLGLAGAFTWRAAHARLGELFMDVGQQVMHYTEARRQAPPRTLFLNGMQLGFNSGVTSKSVSEVLDHFQARCRARNGGFHDQLRRLAENPHSLRHALPRDEASDALLKEPGSDGVFRVERSDRGVVACLDTGTAELAPRGLLERVELMFARRDLSQLGDIRYVVARATDHDTAFLAMWSKGPIPLLDLFPSEGDAPGIDAPNLPRPGGARRLLSAWEQDQQSMVIIYVTEQPLPRTVANYQRTLREAGWSASDAEIPASDRRRHGLVASRGLELATILFSQDDQGQVAISLMPM